MKILSIVVAVGIVIFLEKQNIKKNWRKKEILVFFVSLFIGAFFCAAWVLEVNVINPLEIIARVYRPLSEPITSYISQFK